MSTVTSSYRTYNASNFIEDVNTEISGNEYYIFGSSTTISKSTNSEFSKREFLEKTLFGKKISTDDTFYLIDNNRWVSGTVFDQYDDTEDLSTKKFYAIVYPGDNLTGDYRVFKCLFNNYNSPVSDPPNYLNIDNEQTYRSADGYVWKYMYSIDSLDFEKYRVLSYVPIIVNTDTGTAPISERSIGNIFVTNPGENKGYDYIAKGLVLRVTETEIEIAAQNLSTVPNYYAGQNFYIITENIIGGLFTIDKYTYNIVSGSAIITLKENIDLLEENSLIKPNYEFSIFPRVEITGDGTGAVAIPIFSSQDISGTISSIEILNPGEGYTSAAARVINPIFGFDVIAAGALDVEATLRVVLSPKGGHASKPYLIPPEEETDKSYLMKKAKSFAEELRSKRILIYGKISETDNLSIPSTNIYTKVGIVKNPEFVEASNTTPEIFDNRLELSLNANPLEPDEIVTQNDVITGQTTFSAIVHAVSGNTAFLTSYHGPYKNYPNVTSTEEGYSDIPLNLKRPIVSSQGQALDINKNELGNYLVTRSPYLQKTGEVYYLTNFSPITRTATSQEEYKIVLEF